MFSLDLTREPWIPCATDDGVRQFSLSDVLTEAHNIREIIGETPPVTIALHRLLLAVIHRTYRGPKDAHAWADMYEAGKFDAEKIRSYFAAHPDRFDLFHEKYPFYQTASMRNYVSEERMGHLYLEVKSNSTLFNHSCKPSDYSASPAESARLLLVIQAFDTAGLKTGEVGPAFSKSTPLIQAAVALVRGASLFETIMLNLHQYDANDAVPFPFSYEKDIPAWENQEEVKKEDRWPNGLVDLLTWQSRRMALEPTQHEDGTFTVNKAVVMPGYSFPEDVAIHTKEIMMAFYAKPDGKIEKIKFDENRALWRNSTSIFKKVLNQNFRPRTLQWLSDLAFVYECVDKKRRFPVDFYGLNYNPDRVAQLVFWNKESFDLPLEFIHNDELLGNLDVCLDFCSAVGKALERSMKTLRRELNPQAWDSSVKGVKPQERPKREISLASQFPGLSFFWTSMESRFNELLAKMPDDTKTEMKLWFNDVYTTMFSSFDKSIDSLANSISGFKAMAKARNELVKQLNLSIRDNSSIWRAYLPESNLEIGGKNE